MAWCITRISLVIWSRSVLLSSTSCSLSGLTIPLPCQSSVSVPFQGETLLTCSVIKTYVIVSLWYHLPITHYRCSAHEKSLTFPKNSQHLWLLRQFFSSFAPKRGRLSVQIKWMESDGVSAERQRGPQVLLLLIAVCHGFLMKQSSRQSQKTPVP